ncbi:MAG: AarF/UbiB family protein [Leptospiraceae bacterium]|nr:AarF/UbiB family protein [Leptospiraceae bacterium]MDW7975978.1 AarF/UbiB family protein [Leptospiraceae bacterium]
MNDNNFISGTLSRLFRLGETTGRVGFTLLKNLNNNFKNLDLNQVIKVVDNLSRLKGAPMKVGQMLSLHEDLLPPEIIEILRILQKDTPPVSFSVIEQVLQKELKEKLSDFTFIEKRPFASASIGQVHKGKLKTGEDVILKIQYPGIRKSIKTDLATIKLILSPLFKALELPFEEPWEEIKERLMEEVDYSKELENLKLFHQKVHIENLVYPRYFEEYSTKEVLTLGFEESFSWSETKKYPHLQEKWIIALLKFIIWGFFKYELLHVDPNAANFGFREDGTVVVYDFGCIKKVPSYLAKAYKETAVCVLMDEWDKIGEILYNAGIKTKGEKPLPERFLRPHLVIIQEVFPNKETYFGEDSKVYQRLLEITHESWEDVRDFVFPKDIIFIHRNLIGHFGNLRRLHVKKNWRQVFLELIAQAETT